MVWGSLRGTVNIKRSTRSSAPGRCFALAAYMTVPDFQRHNSGMYRGIRKPSHSLQAPQAYQQAPVGTRGTTKPTVGPLRVGGYIFRCTYGWLKVPACDAKERLLSSCSYRAEKRKFCSLVLTRSPDCESSRPGSASQRYQRTDGGLVLFAASGPQRDPPAQREGPVLAAYEATLFYFWPAFG